MGRPKKDITDDNKLRAVIYARYSPGPNQRDESIEGQVRECTAVAERMGLLVCHQYVDKKMSGTNDNRPSFMQMLADSDRQLFDVVITWKNDRFARNRYDAAVYKRQLTKNGVKIIYAKENIPDGPEGIILESVLEGMAEWYSANLAQNIRRGLRENALKCRVVGGKMPLGYKMGPAKEYLIDKDKAPLIKEIFTRYANGARTLDICEDLNKRGHRTQLGKEFNRSSLQRILSQEKYLGIYRYEDIEVKDGIPRIISDELFNKAQERLVSNKRHKRSGKIDHAISPEFYLTGKSFCGLCGSSLAGNSGTGKRGEKFYYYSCHERRNNKSDCKKKNIRKDLLEEIVFNAILKNIIFDDGIISEIVDRCMEIQEKQAENGEDAVLKADLAEVKTGIKNIVKAIEAGAFSPVLQNRLADLEARQADLETGIAAAQIKPPTFSREQLEYLFYRYRNRDFEDANFKREIIDTFVNKVILFDNKVVIIFNITGDGNQVEHSLGEIDQAKSSPFKNMAKCSPNKALTPLNATIENTLQYLDIQGTVAVAFYM